MSKLLAVYGTLKKGYHNHEVYLTSNEPRFEGFVKLPFKLYSNGRYPMIVKSTEVNNIYLEVYEISNESFGEIIKLEEPFGYHYEMVEITNIAEFAQIFVYNNEDPPSEFLLVENGDWQGTISWD